MDTHVTLHDGLYGYLCCPHDGSGLCTEGDLLTCTDGHRFPVVRGVPRFVPADRYAHTFGYEWNRWPRVQFESENGGKPMEGRTRSMFHDITGWHTDDLTGAVIAEFGCGSGRFIDIARSCNARVIGLDLSSAVEAARANFAGDDGVLIAQADVLQPPIRHRSLDGAYSIGVLHHTPSPAEGVSAMALVVRDGGRVACRVYAAHGYYHYPSVLWHRRVFGLIAACVGTARMHAAAAAYASFVGRILHPAFTALRRIPLVGRALAVGIERFLIVHPNLPDERWRILDIFDAITPSYASTHTAEEVAGWFARAGLTDIHRTKGPTTFVGTVSTATPLVSVVMSVHNGERFLREAVDSILAQSLEHFEFIIIDDASSDGTSSVLDTYDDSRIVRHRSEALLGLPAALNIGIRMARGEYIARMDADDVSETDRLLRQAAHLIAHPDTGVVGSYATLINDRGAAHGVHRRPVSPPLIRWKALSSTPLIHPSVMARASVLREHPYDASYLNAQDFELWSRLLWDHGVRCANIPEPLLRYRIHTDSTTGTRSHEKAGRSASILVSNLARYAAVPPSVADAFRVLLLRRALPPAAAWRLLVFRLRITRAFLRTERPGLSARATIIADTLRTAGALLKATVRYEIRPRAGTAQA